VRYAALLRGVNVGGNKKVPMAELRAMAAEMGLDDPQTLLQSGNLVFGAKTQPTPKLEQALEAATKKAIGVECSYLVRTAHEWARVVAANPFAKQAKADPARMVVVFCREAPDTSALQALRLEARGNEDLKPVGRELFVWYPDGQGTSQLAIALGRNKLGTICSARNWNTVLKVNALLASSP
jgi:uncharacterized protein (DUF1697 family)